MIFLPHFDRFLWVGFFRKVVQNIPLDKSGAFEAIWSCGEILGNFGILLQLKLGFVAARVPAAITISLIWVRSAHFFALVPSAKYLSFPSTFI